MWQALSALRSAETLDQLLDEAPREICWRCGFHRAVLSRIEGSRLVALAAHFADGTEDAESFLERARADPPAINALPIESEMIRRQLPVRVSGERPEMTGDGTAAVSPSAESYVAAPVLAQKRVIGFIHADRSDAGPSLADSDRDALGALTEALAAALARIILLERLRRQRVIVRGQLVSIEALLDEAESPIEIAAPDEAGDDLARIAAGMFVAPESRAESPDALLTRRELEVLGLMAAGATNAGIADRLVISETTVKSHVQHILRKLRASNRAEAVSLYFRRTAGQR